ncbi:hypothetical protein CCHR01_04315 [Colletotrichum chrysophilum]|uniref:Uncharacterized protein n=1 Tax=Colletotrichum chrysophilum TaxID=1836956 RepID=A0AAD9ARB3_9PEZI|nr:hypothetical protein CCHR01_04315 [Colletotrichum chrysophilum]
MPAENSAARLSNLFAQRAAARPRLASLLTTNPLLRNAKLLVPKCVELCLARPECAEARSVITGDSSAPAKSLEKRQFSPCVQACLEELGIWDGKARSICKEQCGEARVKREPVSGPVTPVPAEKRQIQWSECVLACVEETGIRDGKGYVYCQGQCGERE